MDLGLFNIKYSLYGFLSNKDSKKNLDNLDIDYQLQDIKEDNPTKIQ